MKFTVQFKRPRMLHKPSSSHTGRSYVRLQDHLSAVVIEIDDEFHVSIVGLLPYLY